jgi:hypothetical protein
MSGAEFEININFSTCARDPAGGIMKMAEERSKKGKKGKKGKKNFLPFLPFLPFLLPSSQFLCKTTCRGGKTCVTAYSEWQEIERPGD